MRTTILLGLVGALTLPSGLSAQTDTPLEPGSRVRMSFTRVGTSGMVRRVGRLLAVRRDSLFIQEAGANDSIGVPLPQISRVEISRGRHSHVLQGAGIGLFIGAGAGALIAMASGDDPPRFMSETASQKVVEDAMSLGFFGTLIGIIGGLAPTDHWVDVPVRRVNVSLFPTRSGGAGLGMTVSF